MKRENCVNFDGTRCEAIIDDDNEPLQPEQENCEHCEFAECVSKEYRRRERNPQ